MNCVDEDAKTEKRAKLLYAAHLALEKLVSCACFHGLETILQGNRT